MSSSEMVIIFPIILLIIFICLAFFIHIIDADLQLVIDSRGIFSELYGMQIVGAEKSDVTVSSNLISQTMTTNHEESTNQSQQGDFSQEHFPLIAALNAPPQVTFYGVSRYNMFLVKNVLTETLDFIHKNHSKNAGKMPSSEKGSKNENKPTH